MPNLRTWTLPPDLDAAVSAALREWTQERKVERLWARDARLWTGGPEASWLGWLGVADEQLRRVDELRRVGEEVRQAGFTHALLLGMGGSSLCPEVLRMTFGALPGWPELSVLDSTDPAQVRAAEARVDLGRTLFIVSVKSGTTLEPNIFKQYFFERVKQTVGAGKAGSHFIAITDPGSKLEQAARADGFRHILFGLPSIGGRYSALSDFGMVPAAIMGLDVARLLGAPQRDGRAPAGPRRRRTTRVRCSARSWASSRTAGATRSRWWPRRGSHDLGAWLEQLLAESTGKRGKGLIPVDREPLGSAGALRRRIACSSTSGFARRRMPLRTGPWRRSSRPGGPCPDRGPGPRSDRGGVLPLGDRDGRRGLDPGHRSLRPAGCRGEQDRDATADGRVRADGRPAGRGAAPRGGRGPALRRPAQRSRAGDGRSHAGRGPARLTSAGSGPATTRRSSPTSR